MTLRSLVRSLCFMAGLLLCARDASAAPPTFVAPVNGSSAVAGGAPSFWHVAVAPGTEPVSTGLTLVADMRPFGGAFRAQFVDRGLVCDDDTQDLTFFSCFVVPINAPPGTRTITLTVEDAQGRSSSTQVQFTVVTPADADTDGLPDQWETDFGFNPAVAGEAGGDPDGDGRTNLQEFQAGTHPRATVTRWLAEGAVSSFFQTRLALFNPESSAAIVVVRMLASDGAVRSLIVQLGAREQSRLDLAPSSPGGDISIVVEADRTVVAERTMSWDQRVNPDLLLSTLRYGSHAETGISGPATSWYLAEGATHGGFDLFYLVLNPGDAVATVSIEYLRPAPLPPVVRTYSVGAHSRRTIWVDAEGAELQATDVSAAITSDRPIVVERSMYYSTPNQPFAAGHAGAGVTTPATQWFLAEGATGYFDGYLLLANPQSSTSTVTVSYLPESGGGAIVRSYEVAGRSRRTVNLNAEGPAITGQPVSMAINSTSPIVVERAMWWPSGQWRESHLVAAASSPAVRWAIADGEVQRSGYGQPAWDTIETYFLVANPSTVDTNVTITLHRPFTGPVSLTVPVRAQSRVTVPATVVLTTANPLSGALLAQFGAIVESAGPGIVVERATYADFNGVPWASGTAVLASPIP
jgi:hypothetical protein